MKEHMTVAMLKQVLEETPDDYPVYIGENPIIWVAHTERDKKRLRLVGH